MNNWFFIYILFLRVLRLDARWPNWVLSPKLNISFMHYRARNFVSKCILILPTLQVQKSGDFITNERSNQPPGGLARSGTQFTKRIKCLPTISSIRIRIHIHTNNNTDRHCAYVSNFLSTARRHSTPLPGMSFHSLFLLIFLFCFIIIFFKVKRQREGRKA